MTDPTDPLAWVSRAEEDYVLARSALKRKTPLTYGSTFHAQQCAEKYLKALLIARGQPFPKTHDLVALNDLCLQNNIVLPVDADALQTLTAYGVQVRYPGFDSTLKEAQEALKIVQTIRRFARKVLVR